MARPKAKELTERELEVMHVFWDAGEQAVADVQERLNGGTRRLAYTTVATLVRILHQKGFLEQTSTDRPHRFRPRRSFQEVSGRLLGDLVNRVFGGSREALLVRLMDDRRLSPRERESLEAVLRETRRDDDQAT